MDSSPSKIIVRTVIGFKGIIITNSALALIYIDAVCECIFLETLFVFTLLLAQLTWQVALDFCDIGGDGSDTPDTYNNGNNNRILRSVS